MSWREYSRTLARDPRTGKPGTKQLGLWLSSKKNRIVDGLRAEVASRGHGGIARWQVLEMDYSTALDLPDTDTRTEPEPGQQIDTPQMDVPAPKPMLAMEQADALEEDCAESIGDSYVAQRKRREIDFDFRSKEDAEIFSAALHRQGLNPVTCAGDEDWTVTAEAATPEDKESILRQVFEELGATEEVIEHGDTTFEIKTGA